MRNLMIVALLVAAFLLGKSYGKTGHFDNVDMFYLIAMAAIGIIYGLYLLYQFIQIAHDEEKLYQESDASREVK